MEENSFQDCTNELIIENENILKSNCHEPLASPEMFLPSKERNNWLNLNSLQHQNESRYSRERVINIIKMLADMLITPNIPNPLYLGIFNSTSPGIRTTHLNKLAEEIMQRTKGHKHEMLKPNKLLFLFPCFSSLLCGFILGIAINWIFGLVFGASSLVLVLTFIGLILVGSKNHRSAKAVCASRKYSKLMESIHLLLQIMFCYPSDVDLVSKPITPLILMHNLADYSTASQLTLAIVESIWTAVENKYFKFLTRLQCSSKDSDYEGKYKQICCIPTFVLVIMFSVAMIINSALLAVYHKREIVMFTDTTLLPIFVLMTCIIFLGFFGTLPMFFKVFLILLKSPAKMIIDMKISQNPDFSAADNLVKSELERVCLLISTFEAYQAKEQIRLFIMVNSTDNCNRHKLANCIFLLQNLTMTKTTVPIISILAADFHTLINDWTIMTPGNSEVNFFQQFSDSFHLLHSTFHLPLYMDEYFNFSTITTQKPISNSNEMFCLRDIQGGSSFESLNLALTGNKSTPLPLKSNNTPNSYIKMTSFNRTYSMKQIQQMFLSKPDLVDINSKIIKQLLITAIFIEKVLKINNVDFSWDRLIDWIILVINWPFRMNLVLQFLIENSGSPSSKMNLKKFYNNISEYFNFDEVDAKEFLLLAQDDRPLEIFESFISSDNCNNMTMEEIKTLANQSSFLSPHFQSLIKEHMSLKFSNIRTKSLGDFPSSRTPGSKDVSQITSAHNINEEILKTPIAIRKCFTKIKGNSGVKDLSQMTKKDIVGLFHHIITIDPSNLTKYKQKICDLNVTGLVLSVCDLDNLQKEVQMTFGDWQIFKALIMYLREIESLRIANYSDSEEIAELSPQTFDNLAFWTEPEQENNDESDNDRCQIKSMNSSFTQPDNIPIISRDESKVEDLNKNIENHKRNIKRIKTKGSGKNNRVMKNEKISHRKSCHITYQESNHQNTAYSSMSDSADKLYCKRVQKNAELSASYIPIIIPTSDLSPNDDIKRCTCDYWFTIGKDKLPVARVISDHIPCVNSQILYSNDPSDDDEFNPRLSYVLPDSVCVNK